MTVNGNNSFGAAITCEGLAKVYPDGTRALEALDLSVDPGQLLALVGPSGCGKTTLLRMIAGLEDITDGRLFLDDRLVNRVRARDRDIAMVFQNYALYPHMSVFDNMAFGLRIRRAPKQMIQTRVGATSMLLGLASSLQKKPAQLSGGQRQRVAMGRAIVREPKVFLMDEPLSNLDAQLRVEMRTEIARVQRRLGVTTVYVTHDQTEAMVLGDRVAVMRAGVIQQHATPEEVYSKPANAFVARFIGSPPMNLLEADLMHDNGVIVVALGNCRLRFPRMKEVEPAVAYAAGDGRPLLCGIRPEAFEELGDNREAVADKPVIRGVVEVREQLGSDVYVYLSVDGAPPTLGGYTDDAAAEDDAAIDTRKLVVARLSPRSAAREGMAIDLAIDPSGVHFFDRATEERVDIW